MRSPASFKQWAGLDRDRPVVHVGYEHVESLVAALECRIDAGGIDAVAGIARAGILPATVAAQRMGKELFILRCQRHGERVEWLGERPAQGTRVLVVDDFVSRGITLLRATTFLQSQGYSTTSMALFFDGDRAAVRPDYGHEAPGFIRFAWERRDTVPEAREPGAALDLMPPSREVECFGVDLDGVLLPDVRKSYYRKNLLAALSLRRALAPFPNADLPHIDWSRAHIVTGRPACDFAVTRAWLDEHGFRHCALHCRDESLHSHATEDVIAHKAQTLTRLGASVFIESELMQAVQIARHCPTVDVVWWGRDQRLRVGAGPARWDVARDTGAPVSELRPQTDRSCQYPGRRR